jgi:RimJ/RimL family protein N-acetyltransferase
MAEQLVTERMLLRSWPTDDAEAALGTYGDAEVSRWLSPAMDRVSDASAMRLLLQQWIAEDHRMTPPAGRWAIEQRDGEGLIGGAVMLPLPPGDEDLELGLQLHRATWGQGYASEAGRALSRWAFDRGLDEVLAVVRPGTSVPRAWCAGLAWSGSGRRRSITACVFRYSGCVQEISNAAIRSITLSPSFLASSILMPGRW